MTSLQTSSVFVWSVLTSYKIGTTQTSTPTPPPPSGVSTPIPYLGQRTFVGLGNQGATCYMNSLLQTLFMTPDLRQRLYMWSFVETEEAKKEDSIPYQLQLLFGRLQLTKQTSVDTRGLTKSFQWDYRDSFTQHDVQEFCRVLFDAIERSVKGTSQENIINELYQGVLIDYVKCQACGTESQREDKFLDVSLAVKSDVDRVYNDSLEKALDTFVRPEMLTGANQYQCEKCNAKRDAIKGLRFRAFPRIFVIQLKRFDLDYRTMTKKKINDYVSFPQVLDLNSYIADITVKREPRREKHPSRPSAAQPDDFERRVMTHSRAKTKEGLIEDKEKQPLEMDKLAQTYAARNSAKVLREERQRKIALCLEGGEHVYELFSVMVHSGSALGGHYYAYIKCFESDRWHVFNDSTVREVNEEELKQTFGGTEGKGWSNASASAYLLAYRKVSANNLMRVDDSAVPDYIRADMEEDKKRETEENSQRMERLKQVVLRVYYNSKEKTFTISRERKLGDLLQMVLRDFTIEHVSRSDVRLRSYLPQSDSYLESYDGKEELTLEELKLTSYKSLALEQKDPGDVFQPYDPQAVFVKVVLWDDEKSASEAFTLNEKSSSPKRIQINKNARIEELMTRIQTLTGIEKQKQVLLRRTYMTASSQLDVLSQPANLRKTLGDLRITESSLIYLEEGVEGAKQFHWAREFELEQNRIYIKFNSPEDPPAYSPFDLKRRVIIDSRSSLRALKEAIARELGLPGDSFVIRRGYSKASPEIKDLDMKLTFANMMNGTGVFVERGQPTKPDEARLLVALAGNPRQGSSDGALFALYDIGQVIVSINKPIREIKELIAQKANRLFPTLDLDPGFFYLREQVQDRLGRSLKEADRLCDYQPTDNKQICVQPFPSRLTDLRPRDIVISFKVWQPSTWDLGPVSHLVASKEWTLAELGERLAGLVGIVQDNLEAAKVIHPATFVRTELVSETWVRLTSKRDRVESYPLSLPTDGYLLILRDRTETAKPLTDSEKQHFAAPTATNGQTKTVWTYEKPKEKSIVITVKGEKQEEEKQS